MKPKIKNLEAFRETEEWSASITETFKGQYFTAIYKKHWEKELHALVKCTPIGAGYVFNWITDLVQFSNYRNNIWAENMEHWISFFKYES